MSAASHDPMLDPWFEEQKRSVYDGTARYRVPQEEDERWRGRRKVSLGTCATVKAEVAS